MNICTKDINQSNGYEADLSKFDKGIEDILEQVWEVYGGYTGNIKNPVLI
jgi:uncharacterized phage-associated protein